ncbi:SHOCT domain-containing protein [Archaeoglobus neptunius]|uniref:SHOCT domain-containing protein n=1 Tax=Archaeoglobus neptunius TaxID=2798580 RepID=UPI001E4E4AE1|nr:SHOCT domain-containing protein [Archaeoglobus neptunius]
MILGKKEYGVCIVNIPLQSLYDRCLQFVSSNKKWKVTETYKDDKRAIICSKSGISLKTWGEVITIRMKKVDPQKTKVYILSKSGERMDFGKNKENVLSIINFLKYLTNKIEIINEKINEHDLIPIKEDAATYFGGHFKYPLKSGRFFDIGGTTKTGIVGRLALFDDRIEFTTRKWRIIIPLENILVDYVRFEEKDSGKASVIGGGGGVGVPLSPIPIGMGFGGGFLSKEGNLSLLVIPYMDEHGIKHAPRFQIKGLVRDKTEEWAKLLYEKLVEIKKQKSKELKETKQSSEALDVFEKLKKLKELYDAGILTNEEFEEKKRELLDML